MEYQRLVFGYHGCSKDVMEKVLGGEADLIPSDNPYDWLGAGIYFWEYGPHRARTWAVEQAKRKGRPPEDVGVVGAFIQTGYCFDLLDVRYTRILRRAYDFLSDAVEPAVMPTNGKQNDDGDVIKRHLDCAVINMAIDFAETYGTIESGKRLYQTVRGAFEEGAPAFPNAGIKEKTHIQIAVRDPRNIIGYFRPKTGGGHA